MGLDKVSEGYKVSVIDSDNQSFSFITRILINCAGLESDRVADMVGIEIKSAGYTLKFCKGDYFSVGNRKNLLVNHLVYPMPQLKGTVLGIHATLDIQGRLRLGPNHYYIDRDKLDYSVDESRKEEFYISAKRFLPFIELVKT